MPRSRHPVHFEALDRIVAFSKLIEHPILKHMFVATHGLQPDPILGVGDLIIRDGFDGSR